MNIFDRAFQYVIDTEKDVYTDDPKDSGGPTKWGVTLRSYSTFTGCPVTAAAIQSLTREDAYAFYRARYWSPLRCDQIRDPAIAIAIFDVSVLYGIGTAALFAQEAASSCGISLKLDGSLGDKSVEALNAIDRKEFFSAFYRCIRERIDHLVVLAPKNERFVRGWIARADRLLTLLEIDPLNREAP